MDEHTLLKQLAPDREEEPYQIERWWLFSKGFGNVGEDTTVCYLGGDCFKRAAEVGQRGDPLIFTTRVVAWDPEARIITTKTGSRYRVGVPHEFINKEAARLGLSVDEIVARAARAGAASL